MIFDIIWGEKTKKLSSISLSFDFANKSPLVSVPLDSLESNKSLGG